MTSGDLETALRHALARAADPPYPVAGDDVAGRAIRRARRIGRRRSAVGVALVVVATAVASAGVAQLKPDTVRYAGPAWVDEPTSSPPTDPAGTPIATRPADTVDLLQRQRLATTKQAPVDLVVAARLRAASGKAVDLTPVGTVTQAHEARGGWLVVAMPPSGGSALWYVRADGDSREVLPAVDAVVLAPDGRRVAWRDSARLFSAVVDGGQVQDATQTSAPPQGRPISFVGQGVVMARDRAGGYDVWWPRPGESYTPAWKQSVVTVYGSVPDGRTVVGQVSATTGDRPCLALLDAVNALTVLKTACALQFKAGGAGSVSPDGRWLVANGVGADVAMLADLEVAFTARPTARAAGPALVEPGAWANADTHVHVTGNGEVVTVKAGTRPEVTRVEVPDAGSGSRIVVVDRALP